MSLTLEQFLAGIAQVESGGNYHITNVNSGAIGKYQVMPSNVASWTLRALGHSLTVDQFAASPDAQERVAQVILGGYFRKYGAQGAASMWFSGQPNPNSKSSDGGNTVRGYVDKVMAAAGGSSPGTGGGGAAVGGSVAPLDTNALADSYGLSASLVNSNGELKRLFQQAVKGSWTADVFTAKLKNTKWWSTQSDTLRQFITERYTNPATWRAKWSAGQASVNSLAVQVGLGSQISHGRSSALLQSAIYNSVALGWSDARIKDWLGTKVSQHSGVMYGEAGDAFDKLHSLAYANGLQLSSSWYTAAARGIVSGTDTQEHQEARIRQWAAAKYSAFAPQIRAGQNALDLASPYIKAVSGILEVPDTDVDLANSHVAKAMAYSKGGQSYSIWQFENDLRKDPAWKKTQNAQDGAMQTAHQVLTQFGVVF